MKGRKLSLQEVLNLEDGSVVWVEELKEDYKQMSAIHTIKGNYLEDEEKGEAYCFDDIELYYKDELEFYEWIEDELAIPDKIEEPYYSHNIVNKMSVEICKLRGLDLTDENIRLIIEEFS